MDRRFLRKLFGFEKRIAQRLQIYRSFRPRVEQMEDRVVPAFASGSIQGQDNWSGGTIPITASVDQAVDQTGTHAHAGVGSWHVSNDTQFGNQNGTFGGWPFGPGLAVAAGQPSSGAGADRFSATYFFRTAGTTADGSNIEVDLGSTAGDDRNTFMAITNRADADGGLQIRMDEPDGATGGFLTTQIVATNISRGAWHRIDVQASFTNGTANDTFQVALDGVALVNPNSSSPNFNTPNFGTFEGFRDGNSFPYVQSNRLYFRSGAAPSAFGSFSDTAAQGFYFDDISYKVFNSSAPGTTLASYAATFEPAGATANTVYVDDNWVGTPVGADPDGAGPATAFGYDAFATIQDGVNGVTAGGTVIVRAGTYKENPIVNKAVTLLGANAGTAGWSLTRGAESIIVTNGNQTAVVTLSSSNVTVDGFTIDGDDPLLAGIALGSGENANASYGVRPTGAFSNEVVQNNIIKRLEIGFRGDGAATGSLITRNLFDSIGHFDFGYAVSLRTDYYADVTNNVMTRVWSGLHTNNFHNPGGPATWTVSGNNIQCYAAGILYWLEYGSATSMTINNNQISAAAGAVANNFGVLMVTIQNTVSPTFTNNTITGTDYGVGLTNVSTTNTVTLGPTNSIVNTRLAGVYLTDNLTFNPVNLTDLTTNVYPDAIAVNVNGLPITSAAGGTGIRVEASRTMAPNVPVTLALGSGVTIGNGATGLRMDGPTVALGGLTLNNTAFAGQSGDYITLANTALGGKTVTATATSFDGVVGSAATPAQALAIENKLTHRPDNPSLGLIFFSNTAPPVFTSASSTTFTAGAFGSFAVTASGAPAPTITLNPADVLPAGVTFSGGALRGTPAAGSAGGYTLHFTAHNGAGPDAAQTFTLIVQTHVTITGVQIAPIDPNLPNQRSRIDRIVVSFSEGLSQHPDSAFSVTLAGGGAVAVAASWNANFSVATLTFSGAGTEFGSLADGSYTLTVDGDQLRGVSGVLVDADGDGGFNPGGELNVNFFRKYGDADGNGVVDFLDFARFRQALGSPAAYTPAFDFDGNGVIDFLDFARFRTRLGT